MATINQPIEQDTAVLVVEELGHTAKLQQGKPDRGGPAGRGGTAEAQLRPPVVTVMGHVDHGKTSLLDYIRRAKVAAGEAGGITQHIGAYRVETAKRHRHVPGYPRPRRLYRHARARRARRPTWWCWWSAADDGVMPQTIEAIQHARAANVPIVVAVNKIDKTDADPERVAHRARQARA